MSKELPILFNTEMVRAILDGRKTVTRRIVKFPEKKPYQFGDILYVREAWRVGAWDICNQAIAFDYKDGTCGNLTYINSYELFKRLVNQSREDGRKAKCEYNGADFVWKKGESPCRWHPSIHMPKEAARIWLKVTDVRVEQLQNITKEDCIQEGIYASNCNDCITPFGCDGCPYEGYGEVDAFVELWDSTIKNIKKSDLERYGWEANPWVWVIEFERCEKPEGSGENE
ncbi:MAG: hypothetical protein LUI12_09955 [Clostridiales bacterium]|nr:hypothetical protein [Clostridiales bacterium]